MKNLFQASAAEEIERRIAALKPDSHPLWGTMNVGQMVAHCSAGLELASGDRRPPQSPDRATLWVGDKAYGPQKRRTHAQKFANSRGASRER